MGVEFLLNTFVGAFGVFEASDDGDFGGGRLGRYGSLPRVQERCAEDNQSAAVRKGKISRKQEVEGAKSGSTVAQG